MSDESDSGGPGPKQLSNFLSMAVEAGQHHHPGESPDAPGENELSPGAELDGLEIIEKVGRGGMGTVYRAHESQLDRVVAVKVLAPPIAGDPAAGKRFFEEARRAAQLSHPHIATVFRIDTKTPPRYFVMEFVQGQSLAQRIAEQGYLAPEQAVRIALQVCDALQCAHGADILHRDIKPSNILLENHVGRVKITDFGIAQPLSRCAGGAGDGAGTPGFRSPEQSRQQPLDARSDIYSLGMTLYLALTGEMARQAELDRGTGFLVKRRSYPPPSRYNRDVGRELDQLVLKMIDPQPRHRPRNCTVLGKQLRALLDHGLASKRLRLRRVAAWLGPAVLVACCLLAVVVAVPLALHRADPTTTATPPAVAPPQRGEPYRLVKRRSSVTVLDRKEQVLWSVRVDGEMGPATLARLHADRPPWLVVGVRGDGPDTGKILVYDHTGKRAWSRQISEDYPYRGVGVGYMQVRDLLVADVLDDGLPYILVASADAGWFPSKITLLHRGGDALATYWNPGHIEKLYTFMPSGDGRRRILAWGWNNAIRAVRPESDPKTPHQALFCLDARTMAGEAPPRAGTIGEGQELWYALLLPQKIRLVGLRLALWNREAGSDGRLRRIEVALSDGTFLYLDEDGRTLDSAATDDPRKPKGAEEAKIELIK